MAQLISLLFIASADLRQPRYFGFFDPPSLPEPSTLAAPFGTSVIPEAPNSGLVASFATLPWRQVEGQGCVHEHLQVGYKKAAV